MPPARAGIFRRFRCVIRWWPKAALPNRINEMADFQMRAPHGTALAVVC
jgi:hypothetical protein